MESKTNNLNNNLDIKIRKGGAYDTISIGNTGVDFRHWNGSRSLELVFTAKEVSGTNPGNITKLAQGLLGFYHWANSNEGKGVVEGCDPSFGATNSKFYDTLYKLLEKGGHPELFTTGYDGSENIYAGIDAIKFASLPTNDPLIRYLEKIKTRSENSK